MGLPLRAVEVAGPCQWRWLLVDERSGTALADHPVDLDPRGSETEAFEDLYRFLRWRADPDRRVASEAELVGRVGAWIGSAALGVDSHRRVQLDQVARPIVVAWCAVHEGFWSGRHLRRPGAHRHPRRQASQCPRR